MQLFPTYYFYLLIDIKFIKTLWNIWTVQFTTAPNFFAEDYRKKYGIRETMTYKLVPSENSQYWVNICYKDQSASLSILEFILSQSFGAEEFSKICMRLFQFTLTCIYNEWFHLDALILIDIIVCSYLSSQPTPQSPIYWINNTSEIILFWDHYLMRLWGLFLPLQLPWMNSFAGLGLQKMAISI